MGTAPTIRDVWAAHRRIVGVAVRTPLTEASALSAAVGEAVLLKHEEMQAIGAFKMRGAANTLLHLAELGPVPGVVTYSTGNHGMGVAYVARRLGVPAHVCLPDVVPQTKLDGLRRLGAIVDLSGPTQEDAARRAQELEREYGLFVVAPFDAVDVVAGQGTIGLELMEEDPEIDTVLVPLSGGGLLSGVALAVKANAPGTRVIGVCAEGARAMYESVRAGRPVDFMESPTLADSLRGGIGMENRHTLRMVRSLVDDIVLVSEQEIEQAMVFLLREERMVVEGAAAVGVAALLTGRVRACSRTAVLITGRNVASDVLRRLSAQI
ncbi:MAG: pyridoxal-phosphate dependent enzyme [Thermaerobacter sp.]|nr:pyridoxal-phosphate dependent enzyme [Thermaerobacter sp.]